MVNIKANISVTSTSLFPANGSVSTNITEQYTGDADFQTVVVPANSTAVVYTPGGVGNIPSTVFLYVQAPATNVGNINISLIGVAEAPVLLATLSPKDFLSMPVAVTYDSIQIQATNLNGGASNALTIFWGVR